VNSRHWIGAAVTRHLVVVDTETGKVGQIDGPTDKRSVNVIWPDGSSQEVQANSRYLKVVEDSLEYLALLEPQKCKQLFIDDHIAFFIELLSIASEKKTYDAKSIYGTADSADGSLRARLRTIKGELLFKDFESFKKAWKSVETSIVAEPHPVSRIMHSNRWHYQMKYFDEVSVLGKASKGDRLSFSEALEQEDAKAIISSLKNCKTSNKWEEFVKNLLSQSDAPELTSFLIEDIIEGIDQCRSREESFRTFTNSLNFLLQNTQRSKLEILICISIASGEGQLPKKKLPQKMLSRILDILFVVSSIPSSIQADVWSSKLLEYLRSCQFKFPFESDLDNLVNVLSEKPIREEDKAALLEEILVWMKKELIANESRAKHFAPRLQRILTSWSGKDFDSLRLDFMDLALRTGQVDIANKAIFKGLNFETIFKSTSPIRTFIEKAEVFRQVAVPVIQEALGRGLSRYEFALILSASDRALELIKENDLGEGISSSYNSVHANDDAEQLGFLKPTKMLDEISALSKTLAKKDQQLTQLKDTLEMLSLEASKSELANKRLQEQLVAAQTEKETALIAKIRSEIFEIAKAFSNVSRLVRRQPEVNLPMDQVLAEIGIEERRVGIFSKYSVGETEAYDPQFMVIVSGNADIGEDVTVLDPAFTIQIEKEQFVLTKALVCSNMRT
jgi:regulator of replication initiation timing